MEGQSGAAHSRELKLASILWAEILPKLCDETIASLHARPVGIARDCAGDVLIYFLAEETPADRTCPSWEYENARGERRRQAILGVEQYSTREGGAHSSVAASAGSIAAAALDYERRR